MKDFYKGKDPLFQASFRREERGKAVLSRSFEAGVLKQEFRSRSLRILMILVFDAQNFSFWRWLKKIERLKDMLSIESHYGHRDQDLFWVRLKRKRTMFIHTNQPLSQNRMNKIEKKKKRFNHIILYKKVPFFLLHIYTYTPTYIYTFFLGVSADPQRNSNFCSNFLFRSSDFNRCVKFGSLNFSSVYFSVYSH